MRSSRIARQTAQVVEALSSPRRTRRKEPGDTYDSPSTRNRSHTPTSDRKVAISAHSSVTRKRKRGEDALPFPSTAHAVSETLTSTRTSPKKGSASSTPRKARRQPAKKIKGDGGEANIEPPANWERMYNLTKEMRSRWQAPVDTMGCESLAEDKRTPKERRFQTLVALMLSSQTKDTVTAVAMKNLQEGLSGGFTLDSMRQVEPEKLNSLIEKVGFHNNKTKYIKKVVEILAEQHNGDIPDTIEGLVALPGVGPKMAYLCMSAAWGRDEGIGVDVHVHRITNLWGWHKTATPEETRAMLEAWLPRDRWHDINHLLVGFGQTWCPPVGRKCDQCHLSQERLCPSAAVAKTVQKRVKKEVVKTEEEAEDELVKEKVEVDAVEQPVKAEDIVDETAPRSTTVVQDIEDVIVERRRSSRVVQSQ